jgi:hypothetical protein
MTWRPTRRVLRRALWLVLGAIALYLGGVNLLLNTPLGPGLVNLRPRSARLSWQSAWTLWPGHLAVRGLEIHGRMRSRAWTLTIARATARWHAFRLLAREARFSGLQAEGVETRIRRVPYTPPPGITPTGAPAGPAPGGPLRTWRFSFIDVEARKVGTIDLFGLVLDCAGGEASGSFSFQIAGEMQLDGARGHCRGARFHGGGHELARDLAVDAEAELAPYAPRRHPGVEGFDFLTGRLQSRGTANARALLARVGEARLGSTAPAPLVMDLRIAQGAFLPGSVLRVESAADAPTLELVVAEQPTAATQLRFSAPSIEIAGPDAASPGRPLFSSGPLEFVGETPERRVSRLFAATRAFKSAGQLEGFGLRGALRVAAPRVDLETPRLVLRAEAERLSGTLDLAALLARQVWVEGMEMEGAAIALAAKADAPPPEAEAPLPWTVALYGAHFSRVRELALGGDRLAGPFDVALSAGFSPTEGFELGRLQIAAPHHDVYSGGRAVSRGAALDVDLKMAPVLFGLTTARDALRTLSGHVSFAGRVESLGFLRRFLQRVPWLRVDGSGELSADVAFTDGRLQAGSRVRLVRGVLEARILDNVARGSASLAATVSDGPPAPRAAIDIVFPRYEMSNADGERAYVRGRDLRLALASGELDLADVVEDLTASVTARGAEIPDLSFYNAYLPSGAGLAIRSGAGAMDLRLDLDQAAGTARGEVTIASPRVAVEFADVLLDGRLELASKLRSADLERHRFDVSGTRLRLDDVAFHEIGEEASVEDSGWWAQLDLASGEVDWQRPMTLTTRADLRMKDSGFLLSLASRRKRFLSWFKGVLAEEDVRATAQVKLGGGALVIDPLRTEGGKLDLRARMRMAKGSRRIDLFVRLGRLAAGLELRDGRRDIKLLRPEAWYESRDGFD